MKTKASHRICYILINILYLSLGIVYAVLRRDIFFLNIIKSQHIFLGGILPCYILNLHCAVFEVLCYFCVNNQRLLHSFCERGPNPGSCRLTHAVNQMHAQKENTACLFSLQILVSTSYRIHSSVGGKVSFICLKVMVVLWGLNHRTKGF